MALVLCSPSSFKQLPAYKASQASLPPFPSQLGYHKPILALGVADTKLYSPKGSIIARNYGNRWSFKGGSTLMFQIQDAQRPLYTKRSNTTASWITSTQLASNAFTIGTAAVLPFYTLMVLAPKADLTKRSMESSIPYVVLGSLYAYLLYLSWTPETIRLMFASKYWLPELQGIAKMFSNEMTLASAWIHLLAVDLFAARQVYHDGLKNQVETRHSVSLCLLFCPIGILSHVFTKVFAKRTT